jgi:hypothetical protein
MVDHDCVPPEEAKKIGTWTCPHRIVFEYLDDCVYGFPCVENPHDFSPDRESCSEAEIAFWEDAKKRWDAGERDVRGARCETVLNDQGQLAAHYTRTSWGIGVNSIEGWEELGEEVEP